MSYEIEDHGDHVHLFNHDQDDYYLLSRVQAQDIHEATAVVCAGDCACYQNGFDAELNFAKMRMEVEAVVKAKAWALKEEKRRARVKARAGLEQDVQ